MWNAVRLWIFPVSCLGCGRPDVALCPDCGPKPADRICEPFLTLELRAAGPYAGTLRRAIVANKQGERAYLEPFAALLAALVPPGIALVPLPTSSHRSAARGFDQAVEIARRTARRSGGRCCEVLVKRGLAQRGLDRRARLAAGGRFACKPSAGLPEVAFVVDDVCTTGATIADGITTLRNAGVAVIGAAVLARTAPGRNPGT